jgi:hypothetical protein
MGRQAGSQTQDSGARPAATAGPFGFGGARGIRTPDLRNAIAALSQLSYDPKSHSAAV